MGLVPLEMAKHTRLDNLDEAQEYGLTDCILCGSCSYVCPSNIPLVQYFEYGKGELQERRNSQSKLDFTQRLANERTERLEREALAKEAAKNLKRSKRSGDMTTSVSTETTQEVENA